MAMTEFDIAIPRFTQNEVTAITGINEVSLQNWTKRSLLSTADAGGGQGKPRRYSIMDVFAAEVMQRLVDLAVAPSEISIFIDKIKLCIDEAVQRALLKNQAGLALYIYRGKNNEWQLTPSGSDTTLPESFICLQVTPILISLINKIQKFVGLTDEILNINSIVASKDPKSSSLRECDLLIISKWIALNEGLI